MINELSDRANIADIVEAGRLSGLERQIDSHNNRLFTLEKSAAMIVEIHTALIGTLDKPGLVREIKDHSDFIAGCKRRHDDEAKEEKKAKIDWFRWAERGAITAALAYVVAKMKGA